jgi:hypothetical protein
MSGWIGGLGLTYVRVEDDDKLLTVTRGFDFAVPGTAKNPVIIVFAFSLETLNGLLATRANHHLVVGGMRIDRFDTALQKPRFRVSWPNNFVWPRIVWRQLRHRNSFISPRDA